MPCEVTGVIHGCRRVTFRACQVVTFPLHPLLMHKHRNRGLRANEFRDKAYSMEKITWYSKINDTEIHSFPCSCCFLFVPITMLDIILGHYYW